MRCSVFVATSLLFTAAVLPVAAGAEVRTWTDSTGKHQIEAVFVDSQDGVVGLRREDGRLVRIPLEKLSDADQKFVRQRTAKEGKAAGEKQEQDDDAEGPAGGAITCRLELKRMEPASSRPSSGTPPLADVLFRTAQPQSFFMQMGVKRRDPAAASFSQIVKKEPAYASDEPFRGVARLGGAEYAFALDTAGSDAVSKDSAIHYTRLYFDRNHNGDLTDDGVVKAERAAGVESRFPPVSLTLSGSGTEQEYAFAMSVRSQISGNFKYVSGSLYPAVYREGQLQIHGKRKRVVLLDFNGNGRFGDEIQVVSSGPDGQVRHLPGDVLWFDPDPSEASTSSVYDVAPPGGRQHLSKTATIDGRLYDVRVSATGDELTLTPSRAPAGYVTSPHDRFRAALYGDKGVVKVM